MTDKKFAILTIAVAFIVLAVAYILISGGDKSTKEVKVASYQSTDQQKPQVKTENTVADLGQMKVSDEKSADFKVENAGQKSLQLSNITSSCGCTVAQVVVDGQASAEFGMHSKSSQIFELASGKTAIVRVTYRPYVMPVSGPVEREVYVDTNDPVNQKLIFKVTANVQ